MVWIENAATLQGRQDSAQIYAGRVMNNADRFLTGKKNEAPLSKTGLYESSDARCPFERARARLEQSLCRLPHLHGIIRGECCDERLR